MTVECGYPQLLGQSSQPLLDTCRKIKSMGGFTDTSAGVFQKGP
jgi:hypothetical protein